MKRYIAFLIGILINLCNIYSQTYYDVGEIIEIDGHKAIIYEIDESGQHGKAMSVKAFRGVDEPWCNNAKLAKRLPTLSDINNGISNTNKVLTFANENNAISYFPAFAWCKNLGENWYIPSVSELEAFINFWLGNNVVLDWEEDPENIIDNSNIFYKTINNKLLDAGGSAFINGVYTSTVNEDGKVYVFQFDRKKNTWKFNLKFITKLGEECVGRAFIKF